MEIAELLRAPHPATPWCYHHLHSPTAMRSHQAKTLLSQLSLWPQPLFFPPMPDSKDGHKSPVSLDCWMTQGSL